MSSGTDKSDKPEKPVKDKSAKKDDLTFIGIRIPKELHTRLYRAKASLELDTGKFYGMGRLMERVIRSGLERLEKERGSKTAKEQ